VDPNQISRRRLLARLGAGGLALGVGLPATVAAAQEDEAPADGEGDAEVAALLETLELAAAEFYDEAIAGGKAADPAALAMLSDFGRHHREHAAAFGDIAGAQSTGEANRRLLRTFLDQLEQRSSQPEVLRLATDLETAMASTHLATLGDAKDDATVGALASILPVEAQHATAAARVAGLDTERAVPALENLDLALDVTQYPATTTTTTTA
jgi:hypothetical protein